MWERERDGGLREWGMDLGKGREWGRDLGKGGNGDGVVNCRGLGKGIGKGEILGGKGGKWKGWRNGSFGRVGEMER
jgi:hypothetical protein